jgi:hypothetical protein
MTGITRSCALLLGITAGNGVAQLVSPGFQLVILLDQTGPID